LALKAFVSDPTAVDKAVATTVQDRLISQCTPIKIENDKVLLCGEAQLQDGSYLNQHSLLPFQFDFANRKIDIPEDGPLPPIEGSPLSQALQTELSSYTVSSLHNGHMYEQGCAIGSHSTTFKKNIRVSPHNGTSQVVTAAIHERQRLLLDSKNAKEDLLICSVTCYPCTPRKSTGHRKLNLGVKSFLSFVADNVSSAGMKNI
jgi:hypothetical protein